jgi:hypothetical protein
MLNAGATRSVVVNLDEYFLIYQFHAETIYRYVKKSEHQVPLETVRERGRNTCKLNKSGENGFSIGDI